MTQAILDSHLDIATPGYHYISASGSLTFNRGESTKEIVINVRNWNWRYSTNPESPAHQRADFVTLRIAYTLRSQVMENLVQCHRLS